MNVRLKEIPSADVDEWVNAEGQAEGRLSLLRLRPRLKSFLGDPRYSRLLCITWSYSDDGEDGMPSDDELDAMRPLEDRLVNALESAQVGTLAFVLTHHGVREWNFYVSGSADLGAVINDALADLPRMPIELAIEDDANWHALTKILDLVNA
ncbi:MAG: DUF695 domain-containing protein [Pseudomonadota bacterium]